MRMVATSSSSSVTTLAKCRLRSMTPIRIRASSAFTNRCVSMRLKRRHTYLVLVRRQLPLAGRHRLNTRSQWCCRRCRACHRGWTAGSTAWSRKRLSMRSLQPRHPCLAACADRAPWVTYQRPQGARVRGLLLATAKTRITTSWTHRGVRTRRRPRTAFRQLQCFGCRRRHRLRLA